MNYVAIKLRWSASLLLVVAVGICMGAAPRVEARPLHPEVANPVVAFKALREDGATNGSVTFATFGQPFVAGDVKANETLEAITFDGKKLPTQIDWKATNGDGSRRHGIVTVELPKGVASKNTVIGLYPASGASGQAGSSGASQPPQDLDAQITLNVDGQTYSTSFEKLVAGGIDRVWLSGPLVTEWQVSGPVVNAAGKAHDRLWVQFYVRYYPQTKQARVEVVVENTWAFKPDPRGVMYDATISVDGKDVYTKKNLAHTDHARWRKVFWVGEDPQIYVRHDLNYLKATGAIPNYDPSLRVPGKAVAKLYKQYLKSNREPMGISIVHAHMPSTGGRPDIGPLPNWTVLRLLTMDPRLIDVDRGISELAGSWQIHMRDEETKLPVSLERHPQLTTHPNLRGDADNPLPKPGKDNLPKKKRSNKLSPDANHEPSFAFVPYLLSGDYYFLEELQFWAAWNPLRTSPQYRGNDKGLFSWTQVRGQAWSMRVLGQTAYITPDDHPMKAYWETQLQNNIDWYDKNYARSPKANKLGFLGDNIKYKDDKGVRRGIAPWQDDFFTWVMGYLVDLGFESAKPMLDYKARFPVGRMTAPGYCWALGAAYTVYVRDTQDSDPYDSFARLYKESVSPEIADAKCASAEMADLFGKNYKAGDMVGYPWSPQGFPANMQPALAAAVDAGVPDADRAWQVFMNRTTKPNYNSYPNWDIVPR